MFAKERINTHSVLYVRSHSRGTRRSRVPEHWVTQDQYHRMHDMNPATCLLSHTYCPKCFTKFMARVA